MIGLVADGNVRRICASMIAGGAIVLNLLSSAPIHGATSVDSSQRQSPSPKSHAQLRKEFESATTANRLTILKRWAQTEVLPCLAASMVGADARFEGVREMGATIQAIDFAKPLDVHKVTERNESYWRAALEVLRGDEIVSAAHVFLHVANGEIDQADRLAEVIRLFAGKDTQAWLQLEGLKWRSLIFRRDLEKQIRKGIELHDKGKFSQAVALYEKILADYPASAWAINELYYTRTSLPDSRGLKAEAEEASWVAFQKRMADADPLYPYSNATIRTGRDSYLMLRRMELRELGGSREDTTRRLLKYADIALDLEQYGFAAEIYWRIMPAVDDAGQSRMLDHFLYCLEKMGVTGIKSGFKGDHSNAFDRIASERRKLMEDSVAFKAMAVPE